MCVFPVPGGPCIRVSLCCVAARAASRCGLFNELSKTKLLPLTPPSCGGSEEVPGGSCTEPRIKSLIGTPPSSWKIEFRESLILSYAILLAPLSILHVSFLRSEGISLSTTLIESLRRSLTMASIGFSERGSPRLSITISPCLNLCCPRSDLLFRLSLTIRWSKSQPSGFAIKSKRANPFETSLSLDQSRSLFSVACSSSSSSQRINF